ncbi:MAG: universal stress protein [Tepidisphaeraceae bacterium]
MSKILVAVSSALAAQRLVDPVSDLARKLAADVLVVHVSRPSSGPSRENEEAEGDKAVRTLQEGLAVHGVSVQTLLMFSDDIARAILNTADEQQATLLCLGLTGKNVFARLLAGNVPVGLIRNTRIPVLLFPPEFKEV